MDHALAVTLSALLITGSISAETQLTPTVAEYRLDGVKLTQLVFPDGEQRILYTAPPGWKYEGSNNQLVLHPPAAQAEATIARSTFEGQPAFDEQTTNLLTVDVMASIPAQGKNVTLVSQENNPLKIEKRETLLVTIKYDYDGRRYLRSVMFLNWKNEQLRFQLTAPQESFARLQEAFRKSYFSWHNA